MKVTKFRFWLNNISEYVYWNQFEDVLNDQLYDYLNSDAPRISKEQFTGLAGKNGKEIYEGDIAISSRDINHRIRKGTKFEVYYNEFLCHFALIDVEYNENKHGAFDTATLSGAKAKYLEVVGTIHDKEEQQ